MESLSSAFSLNDKRLYAFDVMNASCPFTFSDQSLSSLMTSIFIFDPHVSAMCKIFFHLRARRHVRSLFTEDMTVFIASAMVVSPGLQLLASSFWLFGLHCGVTPARTNHCCLYSSEYTTSTPFPAAALHLLPVYFRINYKIATLTYKGSHF